MGAFLNGCNDAIKSVQSESKKSSVVYANTTNSDHLCSGRRIGVYSWDTLSWRTKALSDHLSKPNVLKYTCGDVYINVADYSCSDTIHNKGAIIPFIQDVRKAGNRAVIWLTYGDVTERNTTACMQFIDTFFNWIDTIADVQSMIPIGVSFDIEHFPAMAVEALLLKAQTRKSLVISKFGVNGLLVQCLIEGEYRPVETDIIMKLADRALMMAYRNYMTSPSDPSGMRNGLMKRMEFMFKEQCALCLDDQYAKQNYRANISIMFETSCKLGVSCDYISFCAYDSSSSTGGIEYIADTIDKVDSALVSTGLMTADQKQRLMDHASPYVLHHWEWAQCFYHDPNDSNHLCRNFHIFAKDCRNQ